ncbi:MAG: hypothetical protein Fur0042_05910 [Cyanophyceae cyanobacterium]
MASDAHSPQQPPWLAEILASDRLTDAQRDQAKWMGDTYELLMELSRFSLSEYSEQVQNLDRIGLMAGRALLLAQRVQPLAQGLAGQATSDSARS